MSQPPRLNDLPLALLMDGEPFPDEDLWRELIAQNPARAWRRYCWLVRQQVWFMSTNKDIRQTSMRAFQRSTGRDPGLFDAAARRLIAANWLWRQKPYQISDFGWNAPDVGDPHPFSPGWELRLIFGGIAHYLNLTRETYYCRHPQRLRNLDRWLWRLRLPTRRTKHHRGAYRHIRGVLAIALEEAQRPPPDAAKQRDGANLGPYPDWDEWRRLVAAGRQASRDMLYELELRAAKFGSMYMPFNLEESLAIGRQLLQEHF